MSRPTQDPSASADPIEPNALPPGTRFGELEILRVLGVGGFGIVYLARDHALQRDIAIKEYMPGQFAQRDGHSQVSIRSASMRDTFELGLRSFVNEARLLARFDHPSLLKVYRFWEAHGTAYMAMPCLQGQNLREAALAQSSPPPEAWLRRVLMAVLDALAVLHAQGVLHRDVAPDNIFMPVDADGVHGAPILLDFGAARQAIGDRTQTLTAILKPSFAPIEQYAESRGLRQGPWTDLYALAAVMHQLITGHCPAPAPARAMADEDLPLSGCAQASAYDPTLLRALDWALRMPPHQRPQDAAALRAVLEGRAEVPVAAPAPPRFVPTQIDAAPDPHAALDLDFSDTVQAPMDDAAAPASIDRPVASGSPAAAAVHLLRARWPLLLVAAVALLLLGLFITLVKRPAEPAQDSSQAVAAAEAASAASAAAALAAATPAAREPVEFIEPAPVRASAAASALTQTREPVRDAARAASAPSRRSAALAPLPELRIPTGNAVIAVPAPPASVDTVLAIAASAPASSPEPSRAEPRSPSEACTGKVFLLKDWCIDRQCERPAFYQHEQCVRLRELRIRPGNQP